MKKDLGKEEEFVNTVGAQKRRGSQEDREVIFRLTREILSDSRE
jgi:hypothetical protein